MDDLAKLILSDLRTCTREYGEDFTVRHISISVERGYNTDDPWLVKYTIGSYGDDDKASGADLSKVIDEFMRRKGWTEANKPMVLIESSVEEEPDNVS